MQNLDLLFDPARLEGHEFDRPLDKPLSEAAYAYHSDFCERLRNPIKAYSTLGAQVTPESGLKQLLLLRYSHALVEEYTDSVYRLQANYAREKEGLSDPRRGTLINPKLGEITRDICFYEEVKERATELAGAVDALVESLKILLVGATDYCDFQCLTFELQFTCTDLKRTIATLLTTLEDHLRLFEPSRAMDEAHNVRLLSILASIFLPLSLACGILSMQTRFLDLHYLLYDFLGVLVLLLTLVAVILFALRNYILTTLMFTVLDQNRIFGKKSIKRDFNHLTLAYLVFGWGLLFSSFLVGMIKDVGLGLKILGYGALATVVIGLLYLLIAGGILFIDHRAYKLRAQIIQEE